MKTPALKKLQEIIAHCIADGAMKDGKITKTKLAKLVYLADFAMFYKFLTPMTGFEYKKLPYGPVTVEFFSVLEYMIAHGIALEEKKGVANLISLIEEPERELLNESEIELIREIAKKWCQHNTESIVDFTHEQLPWKISRDNEVIPYELITQEEPKNVY
ncbi:Panacea domain-containing protein [Candidatus Marithrix sp. Canyon 246]|uniref:Panacea domain-containing protein n=1 Tax=Candidatus Marithrix sp. Canyon 246 TaxID=1827136 RepID=UPI00084A2730|nr:Panacea domain-containing protein [Candidatus Marithrix sp. Canyon 246]